MGKASAKMRSDRSKSNQAAASQTATNGGRTTLRALAFGASVLLAATAAGVSAQPAQGALRAPGAILTTDALGPVARAQIEALMAEKAARTPAQQKIDSRVLLTIDAARPTPKRPALKSLARPQPGNDGRLVVDIDLTDGRALASVVTALRGLDAQVLFASAQFKSLRARVLPATIEAIAALPAVRFVDAEREASHNKNTTSQGDIVHKANLVRSSLGLTGNGVKVCVLSDGVNSLAARQATGDLPPIVDVLPGQAGQGDEGTAMLEVLYDLLPEARLGFATSNGGEAAFAQNILDLANPAKGGCRVIVDDVDYFTESPFQDSVVAQAVETVVAQGVVYVGAAANNGNLDAGTSGTWEGDFRATGNLTSALIPGHTLHEFAPGVAGNTATAPAQRAILYWAEPAGAATVDYDLYVLDASMSTVLASSTNTQNGSQNPFEFVSEPSNGSFPAGAKVVVAKKTGAPNVMFSVQWYRGRLTYATSGSTRGHSAAASAISVSATPAAGAYGPTPPNPLGPYPTPFAGAGKVEVFNADGPRRVFFDGAGRLLPGAPAGNFTASGGVVRNKPDLTAADGVATDTPGFTQFFGTSAAAPHAAAAAAMLLQAFPGWTPQQIKNALIATALDIQTPGWDRTSGAGIVMPLAALQANSAGASAAITLVDVVATELRGNGNGVPEAGEDWQFAVTLGNGGGATATSVAATLVASTAGVTVTAANAAFGSIAVNGRVSGSTPYRFSIGSVACGSPLDFVLQVTSAQNASPLLLPIHLPTSAGLGAPRTFSFTGPAIPIPDGGAGTAGATAIAALPVSGVNGAIGKVVLRIDGANACAGNDPANAGIDHPYVGDLSVALQAPDGKRVTVIGRDNININWGANYCDVTLDDAATGGGISDVTGDMAPFSGTYAPDEPLSAFRGGNANGVWQLQVNDWQQTKTGRINRFSLVVSPSTCGTASAGSMPPAPSLDIDGNGQYDALTDGLLVLRYLLGIAEASLTDRAIGVGAQRTTPAQIKAYLDALRGRLDVDGNGAADGLTDGILVMRYMFGIRGAMLVQDRVGPGATRSTAQIEAYIATLMP